MWARDYFRISPAAESLNDDDFLNLTYEFSMNYSHDGFKKAYVEWDKKKKNEVDADLLRELGYSEEDIEKEFSK